MDIRPMQVPEALAELGRLYEGAGHQIWLVGGCVRDHVLGLPCKDVDLATSATPDEQIALCDAAGYRWIGTGLQHGTITVLAGGEAYEITTFRTDVETDGRHAVVAYTRDLETDLARRDLTMNAIACSVLDGHIVDPFNGVDDALARRVRFVGEPGDRIREDYLRILRWLRFLGRFGGDLDRESPDAKAVAENAVGLSRISVERVWSEMQRILAGPRPAGVVDLMKDLGVLKALGLPDGHVERLADMRPHTNDPTILLAAWLGGDAVQVAQLWKTSNAEREAVAFVARALDRRYGIDEAKRDLVEGANPKWVDAVLRARRMDSAVRALVDWDVPSFPVQGRDLVEAGMRPGREMGEKLRALRQAWIESDYEMGRDQLVGAARAA